MIWDTIKTKRYPQEIPIQIVRKNIRRVHILRHQEGGSGSVKF